MATSPAAGRTINVQPATTPIAYIVGQDGRKFALYMSPEWYRTLEEMARAISELQRKMHSLIG